MEWLEPAGSSSLGLAGPSVKAFLSSACGGGGGGRERRQGQQAFLPSLVPGLLYSVVGKEDPALDKHRLYEDIMAPV